MENSVNVMHLETNISRLSCKNMKKQESFRYHMVSVFLSMVEMLHALHSLWVAFFPFALLWWNVMLCATCAKYYSWNRSRFQLQMAGGRQVYGADAEEVSEKGPLSFDGREDVSLTEMNVATYYESESCTRAPCLQEVEEESQPCVEDCNSVMCTHQNELWTLDSHADDIATGTKEHHDNQFEELSSCGASVISDTHASKALDITLPSCTSKLSSIHFCDERGTQQSGLLKAVYWAAYPFLLPQQLAPLAMHDVYQKLLEYVWMQSPLRLNKDLLNANAPKQLLNSVFRNCSTVEECLQISLVSFALCISLMIPGKKPAHLARQFTEYLTGRAGSGDYNVMQFSLSSLDSIDPTTRIYSSKALEGTMEDFNSDIGEYSSSSKFSDLELSSVGYIHHDIDSEDGSEDIGSLFHDANNDKCVRGCQSSNDLNRDAVQSRQSDVNNGCLAYPEFAYSITDNGEGMGVLHESSIYLNDNYYDLYGQSADWDVKYSGLQSLQEVDSVHGGYYSAVDGVCSNYAHSGDSFEGDNALCADLKFDANGGIQGNSLEVKQLDTWWDEDVVLVEEDSMEQAWQVV